MEAPAEPEPDANAAVVAPEPERVDELQEQQEPIQETVETETENPNEDMLLILPMGWMIRTQKMKRMMSQKKTGGRSRAR